MKHIFVKIPGKRKPSDQAVDREQVYVEVTDRDVFLDIDAMCEAFTRYLAVCGFPMDNREVILIEKDCREEIEEILAAREVREDGRDEDEDEDWKSEEE